MASSFGYNASNLYHIGTLFLDRMIKALNEKMDRHDEKEYNRKRK